MLPFGSPVGGKGGDFLGDEETAIGGEAFEHNFFERELEEVRWVNWRVSGMLMSGKGLHHRILLEC